MIEPALETLLLPLDGGTLSLPGAGRAFFLRARAARGLRVLVAEAGVSLACEQSFKPHHDELAAVGFDVVTALDDDGEDRGQFDFGLMLLTGHRDENLANFARAMNLLKPGGRLLCAQSNSQGARRYENLLAKLAGNVESLSKNKCRAFWAVKGEGLEGELQKEWRGLGALRPILDGRFVSRPGIFGWDKEDAGSKLLAEQLPARLPGRGADLGGGYGYLSNHILRNCSGMVSLDFFEAEKLALEAARENLVELAGAATLSCHWRDVTRGLDGQYDWIVMNPPFHEGRADRNDLGLAFIAAAAAALRRGGTLWIVANRHLPYEKPIEAAFTASERLADRAGFKVIMAKK